MQPTKLRLQHELLKEPSICNTIATLMMQHSGGLRTCSRGTEDLDEVALENLVSIEGEIPQEPGTCGCQQTGPAKAQEA